MPTGSKQPPGVRRLIRRPPTSASEYDSEEKDERQPIRGSFRSVKTEPEPESARRVGRRPRSEEEDEDLANDGAVTSGWGGAKQMRDQMPSDFAQQYTIPEKEPGLIKFLEHEPFANYKQHWAEWLPKGSKLSYVCPNTRERKVCPLCAKGDKPALRFCFNIVDFTDPSSPANSVLIVGFKLSKVLEGLDSDRRTGPLDRDDLYYSVQKTGAEGSRGRRGGTVQTNFIPVNERDLEKYWETTPLTAGEVTEFLDGAYTQKDMVPTISLKTLEKVAEEMDESD